MKINIKARVGKALPHEAWVDVLRLGVAPGASLVAMEPQGHIAYIIIAVGAVGLAHAIKRAHAGKARHITITHRR